MYIKIHVQLWNDITLLETNVSFHYMFRSHGSNLWFLHKRVYSETKIVEIIKSTYHKIKSVFCN
jgi:hypothetical protein